MKRSWLLYLIIAVLALALLTLAVLLAFQIVGARSPETTASASPSAPYISAGQAEAIALALVCPQGQVVKSSFESDENPLSYEVSVICDGQRYEIKIHAVTGAVIEYEKDDED